MNSGHVFLYLMMSSFAIVFAFAVDNLYDQHEEILQTIPTEYDSLNKQNSELRARVDSLSDVLTYSTEYNINPSLAALIIAQAEAEGIEPPLAFGLVFTESSFRTNAVSSAGAIGLTQILPSTAKGLNPDLTRSDLFDPATNLKYGFRYLRQMLDTHETTEQALSAYNGGPTNVRNGWRNISYEQSVLTR